MAAFAAPLIIGGLSALGGLFGGNKSTSNSTTTTTPNFTSDEQALISKLFGQYGSLINGIPAFNKAYETSGLQNFLNSSVNANQNAEDALASRGIARTTAGAQGITNTGYQEGNQIANFLAQAPIAEQQNTTNLLNSAGSFEASLPVGSTSNSNTTATGNAPINPVAGFLGGGAQGLAAYYGQQTAANNLANILKNLPTYNPNNVSTPTTASSPTNNIAPEYPTDNFNDTATGPW